MRCDPCERKPLSESSALAPLAGIAWRDIPILINSYNRLGCLRRLIDWLRTAGHRRLYVLDNASTYPPLLEYLRQLEQSGSASVVRLGENLGHLALWRGNLLKLLGIATEYVYTDPDVVPAPFCPADAVGFLQRILADEPDVALAGLGLRLDDIPACYPHRSVVLAWEQQFWLRPAAPGLFLAPIDTTFALYRPGAGHGLAQPALRTGWPYLAAHEGWYADPCNGSEEDRFYQRATLPETSHWSVPEVPAWLRAAAADHAERRPVLLQLAQGEPAIPGYGRLDVGEDAGGMGDEPVLPDLCGGLDGIYCAQGFDRVAGSPPLMRALHRAAKPGGRLVGRFAFPAARAWTDDGRLGDDLACTFAGFGRDALQRGNNRLMSEWRLERLVLLGDCAAVSEIVIHLRAVKPSPEEAGAAGPPVEAERSFSRLHRWDGFARVEAEITAA